MENGFTFFAIKPFQIYFFLGSGRPFVGFEALSLKFIFSCRRPFEIFFPGRPFEIYFFPGGDFNFLYSLTKKCLNLFFPEEAF